jgi:hypothetical protein
VALSDPIWDLRRSRVSITVAPNGVGHAVRALRVLRSLVEAHGPFAEIAVAMAPSQLEALTPSTRVWLDAAQVRVIHGVVEPGVGIVSAPGSFADGQLVDWERRWAAESALATADLVVSDNLAGVLRTRGDAVLMGSFLWSDVLAAVSHEPGVADFVDHERALLATHRPVMLATADVAHPGVIERTDAVLLPWFDDRAEAPERQVARAMARPAVAVVGGTTGAADDLLQRARKALMVAGREVVDGVPLPGSEDWERVGTLVCRPGIGTVTAGVVAARPLLLLSEVGNPELDATTAAMVRLGLARALEDPEEAVDVLDELDDPEVRRAMVASMVARPTGGHRVAAELLASRLAAVHDGSDSR